MVIEQLIIVYIWPTISNDSGDFPNTGSETDG